MTRRAYLTAAFALLAIGTSTGQEPSFRISVNVVQIDATVTGSHGKPVRGLAQSDFEIWLDGKPQPIISFSHIQTDAGSTIAGAATHVPAAPAPAASARLKPEQVSRTVVIFVDDLTMAAQSVTFVRKGVLDAIEKRVGPGDLTAIVRASAGFGALQDFTTDKAMLRAAADQIRWNPSGRFGISAYQALGTDTQRDLEEYNATSFGGGAFAYQEEENYRETTFTTAVLDSLRRVVHGMARLPGRKSVIILSDRLPVALREISDGPMEARTTTRLDASGPILNRMRDCIDQAARSGVVIDAIDTRGLASLAITAADESKMIHKIGPVQGIEGGELAMKERHEIHDQGQAGGWYLAKETGGLMIPEANDIGASLSRIYDDMESYYVLSFHPSEEAFERAPDGHAIFRRITVKVKREGVHVRSRSGFFGVADGETTPQRAELSLASSLDSPFGSSAVDLRLRSSFLSARKNQWLARTALWVNARDLTLEGPANHRAGIIHLLVRAFGANGGELDGGIDEVLRVSLDAEGYQRALKYGLVYSTVIPVAKPGPYQVRAALLDQASGKIGTANQFLLIPEPVGRAFLLSGIVFPQMMSKEDDITPATGPEAFAPGQTATIAFEVIGGANEKTLQVRTLLYRDGELVKQSDVRPLSTSGRSLHGSIFAKSEIAIPDGATAGAYRMQVIFSEPAGRTASQWTDLPVASSGDVL